MFSYDPLWKKLIDYKMNKTQLIEKCKLSRATVAKMGKNEYVDMSSLDKICSFFKCDLNEIVTFISE